MTKLIQLFELLSLLLPATAYVFASFCTHGASYRPNTKIDRLGAGSSKRWLPSRPLHLKRANIPEDFADGFPSSQEQSLDSFAVSPPADGVPSVNSGGLDPSGWKNNDGLKDFFSQASQVDHAKATASESLSDAKQLFLDTVNNMPRLDRLDRVGVDVDDLKAALVSSAAASREALKSSSAESFDAFKQSTAANLEVVKASTAATLGTSREALLGAQKEMIDKAVEVYSSETFQTQQAKVIDVGQKFSTVMESKYHLSELADSIMRGDPLKFFMDYVSERCQSFVDAMDLKNNAPFIVLLVTIFWASIARRDGIEYGKMQAQGTIDSLQDKLESTKAAAKTETELTTSELKDLRTQLVGVVSGPGSPVFGLFILDCAHFHSLHPYQNALKSQVETLTVATQDVSEQLNQGKADATTVEVAHTPAQEIVETVTNDAVATTVEVAHTPVQEIVEKVTNDAVAATASSSLPEHNVKAEEAFKAATKAAGRAPKKATPNKMPSTVEIIAPQVTDIATLSSDADVAIEPEALSSDSDITIQQSEVEVGDVIVPTAEAEVAQSKKVTPKKSSPKKKAPKVNVEMVEGSMSEIYSESTVTMEPEVAAMDATQKEAKPVQSKLSGTKAKAASGTDGAKKLKEAAKKTSTMRKKTIVVTGATGTENSVKSEAPPEAFEETKKRAPTSVSAGPDWGNLSESTLKRKTVKELVDYLEMKGVEVPDTEGKKLNKDTLVNLVISS
jgi:hypothetical protein